MKRTTSFIGIVLVALAAGACSTGPEGAQVSLTLASAHQTAAMTGGAALLGTET